MSGAAGLKDLAVVLKVYESMEKGVAVVLTPAWPGNHPHLQERGAE
jgi:hypothetical protein